MNKKQKIVCTELNEILKGIEEKYVNKIPKQVLDTINYFADYDEVSVNINWNKPLTEQQFDEDTINILAWINYKFWVEDPKEKQELKKIFFPKKVNNEPLEEERDLLQDAFEAYEKEHANILLPRKRNNIIENIFEKIRKIYK